MLSWTSTYTNDVILLESGTSPDIYICKNLINFYIRAVVPFPKRGETFLLNAGLIIPQYIINYRSLGSCAKLGQADPLRKPPGNCLLKADDWN